MRAGTGIILATVAAALAAGGAQAQGYAVGQAIEANMGSGPWMACTVVKHNVKQEDYEVSCPARPADTFRAGDNPDHIRPRRVGSDALTGPATAATRPAPATAGAAVTVALPRLGPAPARSASNILLGRWRLSEGDCSTIVMEFLPKLSRDYARATVTSPAAWSQRDVEYFIMTPREIVAKATVGGGWGKYKMHDANHLVVDSMFQCGYTRM